jgi:hypothetical protein
MRLKSCRIIQTTILAGLLPFGYLPTGCAPPRYAPRYSDKVDVRDTNDIPEEQPEYADAPAPAQAPRSSKGDLVRMAEHQQNLIRALRRRVKELENNPEEVSEQTDNLIPQDQLAPMSTSSVGRTVDRQQRLIAALKARIRELENKKK